MTKSQDAIRTALVGMEMEVVKSPIYFRELKELRESLIMQYMNEKGEEAIRGWGVIKGLNMAIDLVDIYKASISSTIIKPNGGILKP